MNKKKKKSQKNQLVKLINKNFRVESYYYRILININ